MKKQKGMGIILVVMVAVVATVWFGLGRSHGVAEESNHDACCPKTNSPDGHEAHAEENVVHLAPAIMKEFGVELGTAGPGQWEVTLTLSGEISFNRDRLAHVVPRVSGVVSEVRKVLGDAVKPGDILAVIESRELADAKAEFLAAGERVTLMQANLTREEGLWQKKITAEKDYLESRQAFLESQIALKLAQQKLLALGYTPTDLKDLAGHWDSSLTRYEMTAPLEGTVVEKHMVLGEMVGLETDAFVVADLSRVWVDFRVYPQDVSRIQPGQRVILTLDPNQQAEGTIAYVSPVLSETTRTALARVVLDNTGGHWQPGQYVTGQVVVDKVAVALRVPAEAVERLDGQAVVFVPEEEGFRPQTVTLGRVSDRYVEIVGGLEAGQSLVVRGAYTLKSELKKPSGEVGCSH